jgi:hypothetical protein
MIEYVVIDDTVEFQSIPQKIMPVMAIFSPKRAQTAPKWAN